MDNKQHPSSQTWQVYRAEFDQMMLNNAREQGVEAHEGVRVLEVLFEGERAVGVRIRQANGEERTVYADVVVDASGQSTMIQSRLGLRQWDPVLKKAALWTYWEGAYRDTGRDEGPTLVLQIQGKQGWFWYIPLHGNKVSVGVVAAHDYLFKSRGEASLEQIYWQEVEKCPEVKRRISGARQADEFHAAREYSYQSTTVAGDGWVLVGDAFGFLDPLYSSGVLLALTSGSLAADAICDALAAGDVSAARLGRWQDGFVRGMNRMRRLVCEYYDGFSFGRFVKKHPHLKGHLTDLLIGDLFDDKVDDVIAPMDEMKAEQAMAQ